MADHYWHIKNCNLFQQLPDEEIRFIERNSFFRKFPRGTVVYLPYEHADGVLLLASGRVKICTFSLDGKQTILTFVEPGELFGELSAFGQAQRENQAQAIENSSLMLIPNEEIHRLLRSYPEVSMGITKLIGFRRQRIERRLKYLLFHSNRERLIHVLMELAEDYGRQTDNGIELSIRLSHQDLANIIGATRETVTVILGDLQRRGRVRLHRRRVIITDPTSLLASIRPQASPQHQFEESKLTT